MCTFDFSSTYFSSRELCPFFRAIHGLDQMTSFVFDGCIMDDQACDDLIDLLNSCNSIPSFSIHTLSLKDCFLPPQMVFKVLSSLSNCRHIDSLNLAFNFIDNKSHAALYNLFSVCSFRSICLDFCFPYPNPDICLLIEAISSSKILECISMQGLPLNQNNTSLILQTIARIPRLKQLDLSYAAVHERDILNMLENFVVESTHIIQIALNGWKLLENNNSFLHAIITNPSFRSIELMHCGIKNETIQQVRFSVRGLTKQMLTSSEQRATLSQRIRTGP